MPDFWYYDQLFPTKDCDFATPRYESRDSRHHVIFVVVLQILFSKWRSFYLNQNFRQPVKFFIEMRVNTHKRQQLESQYPSSIIELLDIKQLATIYYKNGI